jgi:hypothetical protein
MTTLPTTPALPSSRGNRLRTLAAAGMAALLVGLAPGTFSAAWAQDDGERPPAWRRIADRIAVNSLEGEEDADELFDGEYDYDGDYDDMGEDIETFEGGIGPEDVEEPIESEGPTTDLMEIEGVEITEEGVIITVDEVDPATMGRPLSVAEQGTIGVATGGGRRGQIQINLGKESHDTGDLPPNLFENPEVLRLLGDDPRFIYTAVRTPDPMVFPPVRNAAIYAELTLEAQNLISRGELEEAQERYHRILELDDRRYTLEMRRKIEDLNRRIGRQRIILEGRAEPEARLPQWVRANTRGILYEENDPMALVGDFTLRVGDVLPNFPDVKVEAISKQTVRFRVADRQSFNVAVKGLPE